ncbi:MAG: hypothetical protein JW795_06645 [Chitinivibrionales bacterium]|nr:hypothetical protein [Chitinivibrionales bacterium]
MTLPNKQEQARALLSEKSVDAFEKGFARTLIVSRNQSLGNLIGAERAVFYLQIVYRMLLFRREHELEPLHEDLYRAVRPGQESCGAENYTLDQFLGDINCLIEWNLITVRLEKERIRGYKDTRRTKYRYSLQAETIAFLMWLEERLEDEIVERGVDARDLLEEMAGTVHELLRMLRASTGGETDENTARRILFQIHKLSQITSDVNDSLVEFNARLLSFLICEYDIEQLRQLLSGLQMYVEKYMIRIGALRQTLVPDLRKLQARRMLETVSASHQFMEAQRRATPRQFRMSGETADPALIPRQLMQFYREQGTLDTICHRIHDSALRVWNRMSTHLKELERKSHRIDDLRQRMKELAAKPEHEVPLLWIRQLLSWGHMIGDMHYFSDRQRADPPKPRKTSWKHRVSPVLYLQRKTKFSEAVQSMEQTRLARLKAWVEERFATVSSRQWRLSQGPYASFDDLQMVIELAKAGLLSNGKKLRSVDLAAEILSETVRLSQERMNLACRDTEIKATNEG